MKSWITVLITSVLLAFTAQAGSAEVYQFDGQLRVDGKLVASPVILLNADKKAEVTLADGTESGFRLSVTLSKGEFIDEKATVAADFEIAQGDNSEWLTLAKPSALTYLNAPSSISIGSATQTVELSYAIKQRN